MKTEDLREALSDLPFGVREALIGNVVIGAFSEHFAVTFGRKLAEAIRNAEQNQKNS